MDWSDSPEQAAFRADVRAVIQNELPAYYRERVPVPRAESRRAGEWHLNMSDPDPVVNGAAREWTAALQRHHLAAPGWPVEYGGGGRTTMEQFIINQELEEAEVPSISGGLVGAALILHGTEEQKRKFLPGTVSGEYLWAQGFSEPGAGSDLASLTTRAVLEGDEYVINGQKIWTSSAHRSNWLFGLFRTDPDAPKHRGISFLLMDMRTPGISIRPLITVGWEHAINETFFENVHVPADQLVGEANRGWYVAMNVLEVERSNISGAVVVQREVRELLEDVHTPRGQQQTEAGGLERQRLAIAQHYMEASVLFNFSCRIISLQAAKLSPDYEVNVSKVFAMELFQRLANTGMRVYGLYSNIWDEHDPRSPHRSRFTHLHTDAVAMTVGGGTSEIQRGIIATRGLGLPR